jgi:hypothetical protein
VLGYTGKSSTIFYQAMQINSHFGVGWRNYEQQVGKLPRALETQLSTINFAY